MAVVGIVEASQKVYDCISVLACAYCVNTIFYAEASMSERVCYLRYEGFFFVVAVVVFVELK